MEFRYRATDDRPTTHNSHPTHNHSPLPVNAYFPEPPFIGGFSMMGTNNFLNTSGVLANDAMSVREALRREIEKAQIRRERETEKAQIRREIEIEKAQIRREIMAREVTRRMELEEEVRRELALERGEVWGIAAPHRGGFSFEESFSMRLNHHHHHHPIINPFESDYDVPLPKPPVPQLEMAPRLNHPIIKPFESVYEPLPKPPVPQLEMAPVAVEIEPSPDINKDRLIILDKPNPDVFAAKRKAVTPPVLDGGELPPIGLKKKPKEEWSCALCRVSTTSENGLNNHLKGKKHKAKEAALKQQKVGTSTHRLVSSMKSKSSVKCIEAVATATPGLDARADSNSLKGGINGGDIDHKVVDEGIADSKTEEQLVQNGQNTGLKKGAARNAQSKKRFWCEVCKVQAFSQDVMESHKRGKKHLKLMKKFKTNH